MKLFEQRIRESLAIDESSPTGLRWNHGYDHHVRGKAAGTRLKNGYWHICVSVNGVKRRFLAHRLAWFLAHGRWPEEDIDHINGDRSDNRIANLREASRSENLQNAAMRSDNTSGVKGVYFNKARGKWQAYIRLDGKQAYLGIFTELADASLAIHEAREKHHGTFANHGIHLSGKETA